MILHIYQNAGKALVSARVLFSSTPLHFARKPFTLPFHYDNTTTNATIIAATINKESYPAG